MKIHVQIVIEEENQPPVVEQITQIEREVLLPETLGLNLEESKKITSGIQEKMVDYQVNTYIQATKSCACCGQHLKLKGYHSLIYRTLFGKLQLRSPRLYHCDCQPRKAKSFSPLASLLNERSAPELTYLEIKWASLMSYGFTAQLLEETLPLKANISSIFYKTHEIATRLENELGEEKLMYIDGCPNEWGKLPKPDMPLTVGIDGAYIHAREGKNRKAGWFEVIVGKSLQENQENKRFGFVSQYDKKPKRRLHTLLKTQGFQLNQAITFLSDGGDNVRDLQHYLSPYAEYILDWFHVTMRITVMKQMAKSIKLPEGDLCEALESIKWYLWHGNVYKGLQKIADLSLDLEVILSEKKVKAHKLWKNLNEFETYITNNASFIPNYADRYAYGEHISTGFVESTVNELISKCMVKKQQMRWTQKGAHLLLQIRIKTLNNELRKTFHRWYPAMNDDCFEITDKRVVNA